MHVFICYLYFLYIEVTMVIAPAQSAFSFKLYSRKITINQTITLTADFCQLRTLQFRKITEIRALPEDCQ